MCQVQFTQMMEEHDFIVDSSVNLNLSGLKQVCIYDFKFSDT
jgi:hypothetical protein